MDITRLRGERLELKKRHRSELSELDDQIALACAKAYKSGMSRAEILTALGTKNPNLIYRGLRLLDAQTATHSTHSTQGTQGAHPQGTQGTQTTHLAGITLSIPTNPAPPAGVPMYHITDDVTGERAIVTWDSAREVWRPAHRHSATKADFPDKPVLQKNSRLRKIMQNLGRDLPRPESVA